MLQEKVTDKIEDVVTNDIWGGIKDFLDLGVQFGEGDKQVHVTIGLVLLVLLSFVIASFILKWIRVFFTRKMEEVDKLKFISVFKFIKYVTYIIVIFVVLSLAGINVTPFIAASAALLVGLGLALQELFQDIIAGIFIIIDKSLLVGDIIEINGKVGRVIDIKLRTTRALTRDDKIIIIPNHKFITETIFNYTQNHKTTREFVQVGVAYGSDTQKVKELLLNSVDKQSGVLKSPKPFVLFEDFGDSALIFSIYFFISDSFVDPRIKSEIRFRIDRLFRENGITIPFPQRDVHLYTNQTDTSASTNMAED
ncbi:MAG: mechanosensitive ion channel [Flavobacteriales bacterium]|jgi:small-conductance mechanosensitive channel|uniref:mechanosensitive ion channel family protein n=1 Tax=Candidatus Ulvibacter alkanivorans TaxID=2267620 RepID=UPI000DF2D2A2|nr:mechanosensitive ion channel domain-containing protein [Candidatus Ulvibacter alkanivorans]MCH2489635.1 mechanosensitive ion channel [Flavobacteriales bacterium]